jgi:hypothetical protein
MSPARRHPIWTAERSGRWVLKGPPNVLAVALAPHGLFNDGSFAVEGLSDVGPESAGIHIGKCCLAAVPYSGPREFGQLRAATYKGTVNI